MEDRSLVKKKVEEVKDEVQLYRCLCGHVVEVRNYLVMQDTYSCPNCRNKLNAHMPVMDGYYNR